MRRAARIDSNQRDIVQALRQAGCEVVSTAAMGSGFPDLLVYREGTDKIYLVECKNGSLPPSKRRLTPHQQAFRKRWPVHVVTDEESALKAVGL